VSKSAARCVDDLLDVIVTSTNAPVADTVYNAWRTAILTSLRAISNELTTHSQKLGSLRKRPSKAAVTKAVDFLDDVDTVLHQLERWLRAQPFAPLRDLSADVQHVRNHSWDADASSPIGAYHAWIQRPPADEPDPVAALKEYRESEELRRLAARKIETFADALDDLVRRAERGKR
jgi:hypothetical protein